MHAKRAGNNNGAYIMISVTYEKSGETRELRCSGHAWYNPGNDVVCAAVSALCGALIATLLKHRDDFKSFLYEEDKGECRVICTGEAAAPYFEVTMVGLLKIEKEFPGYLGMFGYYEGDKYA